MNNTKKTVYVPIMVENELPTETGYYKTLEEGTSFFQKGDNTWWDNDTNAKKRFPKHWLKQQQAFVFIEEQLNELLTTVIKDTLQTAADYADTKEEVSYGLDEIYEYRIVDQESILNTFQQTFNKHKV